MDQVSTEPHIIIIEDDAVALAVLEDGLAGTGVIVPFKSAESALSYIQHKGRVDVVVSDLVMPGMNGVEFVKALMSLKDDVGLIPIIVYTAHTDVSMERVVLNAGAVDIVSKKGRMDQLRRKISSMAQFRSIAFSSARNANMYDPLTRLLSHSSFFEVLSADGALDNWSKEHDSNALFLFDIKNFRSINSVYGVSWGDKILTMAADVMVKNFSPKEAVISRLYSDRFLVLVPANSVAQTAKRAASFIDELQKICVDFLNLHDQSMPNIQVRCRYIFTRINESSSVELSNSYAQYIAHMEQSLKSDPDSQLLQVNES